MTDDELMQKFSRCSIEAYKDIYNRNKARVTNFIVRSYNVEPGIAEDISQNCFIKVYESKFQYRHRNQFSTWMFTIAKNFTLNEIKRNKRIVLSEENELIKHDRADEQENITDEEKIIELIKKQMMRLPDNYREILILRYDDNLQIKEIADITNKNINTVKSLLKRGLENIREKLSSTDFENI